MKEDIVVTFSIKQWKAKLVKCLLWLTLLPLLLWLWPYYQLYLARMEGEAALVRHSYDVQIQSK